MSEQAPVRNVLLLHCHDLGRFLGAYGVPTVVSPHLDLLAAEGTLFETAFATAPHCSPARASLFTGTYPQTNGVLGLTHDPFGWDLLDPGTHLARRLRDAGYRTELVGVHHESRVLPDEEVAARLGFDRVRTGGDRDVVVRRANEALSRAAAEGRPFYVQAGFHEPHRSPSVRDREGVMGFLGDTVVADGSRGHTVPPYLRDNEAAREEIAELQGAVRHMDAGVGAVLDHLDLLGLRDETIVLFTTDHGLALPRAKCTLYDAGLEVALMMRVPGREAWRGRGVRPQVSHVDVLPTLLELVGLPVPSSLPGSSLVGLLEDGRPAREHVYGQLSHHIYYDPKRSVRSAAHKLIVNFSNAPKIMDPTQSWVHRSVPADLRGATVGSSPTLELYDLVDDPYELVNRADDPALEEVRTRLAAELYDWMRRAGDPLVNASPSTRRHQVALAALKSASLTCTAAAPAADSHGTADSAVSPPRERETA